ncbi:helix-turn-helix domain-containing protein [Saccharopolyspora sp. 5N102]|uniref:helix-turn-helix domain-containing protein n=1 Tax=Saccharopolyspora sp. 5N102 TaxID=3375155 RepID=UPI00378947F0
MSKDWAAVAAAINTRLADLDMTQRELAERSGVSTATLRQLQAPETYPPKRRTPRLLAAISSALRWPQDRIAQILEGQTPAGETETASTRSDFQELQREVAELRDRVAALERQSNKD